LDDAVLTINEIFHSIQGESTHAGRPCVFVRLTACDLRCSWCDTPYAFTEGHKVSIDDVVARVKDYGCPVVEITGGEPLLQKNVYPLMQRLLDEQLTVMVETGGHLSIEHVPPGVLRIMDVKCPGSGESHRNEWTNMDRLVATDEVKFVIKDRADYDFAREVVTRYGLIRRVAAVHFSPVHDVLESKQLAEWILADRLEVRLQLQMHKYIWDPTTRGV
jgi:7-carboxy-7-deazaguanine synthase